MVVYDDDPLNPRTDYDNFGTMVCWHSRYNLGNDHNYEDSADLFRELVRDSVSAKDIVDYVKSGKAEKVRLAYNKSSREWELNSYWDHFEKWYSEAAPSPFKERDLLADTLLEEMRASDLKALAQRSHIITPLFLYDHSGLRISCADFHDRWDSGQVGWIYASHEDIKKEYGDCSPESIEKAEKLLLSEVSTYDAYISGQCYGFMLYENGNEIDSCWGFLGSFNDVKDAIKDQIGSEHQNLVDSLEDSDYENIEDILENEYEEAAL